MGGFGARKPTNALCRLFLVVWGHGRWKSDGNGVLTFRRRNIDCAASEQHKLQKKKQKKTQSI